MFSPPIGGHRSWLRLLIGGVTRWERIAFARLLSSLIIGIVFCRRILVATDGLRRAT